jgi:hypothetical protein
MTNIGTVLLLIVCVGIGYVLEPIFFTDRDEVLTKPVEKPTSDVDPGVTTPPAEAPVPRDQEPPAPIIEVDLSKITPDDFPAKVELKVPHTISDANSGVTMKLEKGIKVKPVRLDGGQLVIQLVGLPIESLIDVDSTNFKELAVPRMIERLQNAVANKEPEPAPPATPVDSAFEPPVVTPPTPAAVKLDEAAIIALLKADVKAGKVTEFKASQVTGWEAGDELEFDGDTYQTGHVTFKAETILGVQEHEAIALIEDGKVYKWMWAKTKLEMR